MEINGRRRGDGVTLGIEKVGPQPVAPERQPLESELSALDITGYRLAIQDEEQTLVGGHGGLDEQPNGNRPAGIAKSLIFFRAYNLERLVGTRVWWRARALAAG